MNWIKDNETYFLTWLNVYEASESKTCKKPFYSDVLIFAWGWTQTT